MFITKIILFILSVLSGNGSNIQPTNVNDPLAERIEQALAAASTAAPCPTRPDEVADFASVLAKQLGLRASEHPAFGGVVAHHSANSLHPVGRAVDLNGDREVLEALRKALEGPRKDAYCIIAASVEENSFHLGFANCNPKEGDCEALNSPPLD